MGECRAHGAPGCPRARRPQGSRWLQHKDMGTHGGSSSPMLIANITVRHQQHNPPRHSQRKRRCLEAQGDLKISEKPRNCCTNCNTEKMWSYWSRQGQKMKGLEHLLYEERLRELGPFRSIPCSTELMRTDDLLAQAEEPMAAKDKAGMPRQGLSSRKTSELTAGCLCL